MVRHAFDSRITPMEQCSVALIVDMHGTVGIEIKSMIPASMKQSIYETAVAATLKDILCCKCTCQSGSQGEERVVCVHTYVGLYLLSILLHKDLAEHILLELAARIGVPSNTNTLSSTMCQSIPLNSKERHLVNNLLFIGKLRFSTEEKCCVEWGWILVHTRNLSESVNVILFAMRRIGLA
jgi:hypothetical protein